LSLDAKAKMRLDKETETVKILADVYVGEIENQLTKVKADRAHRIEVKIFNVLLVFTKINPNITEKERVIEDKRNKE
jgi:hypothetical protein